MNLMYVPLDRHDIEISYLNNIIDSQKLNSGEKLGIDANLIDKYLWNIGNDFCNKENYVSCPLYDDCKTKEDN